MAKQGILDIEKLNRYAKDYDNVLRTLPYFTFQEFAAADEAQRDRDRE